MWLAGFDPYAKLIRPVLRQGIASAPCLPIPPQPQEAFRKQDGSCAVLFLCTIGRTILTDQSDLVRVSQKVPDQLWLGLGMIPIFLLVSMC